jgi:hypothetical protein
LLSAPSTKTIGAFKPVIFANFSISGFAL